MDSETRALRGTALVLLAISAARWIGVRPSGEALAPEPAPLGHLIDSSRAAEGDQQARALPLVVGERLDPNTASEVDLDRLPGIGASTAAAIVRSRVAGGPFQQPADLARVAGIGLQTVTKIAPFLEIDVARARRSPSRRSTRGSLDRRSTKVDLNRTDSLGLLELPGIGPALAGRILAERRKQPFRSVQELTRVRGVGPSTVERLRSMATVRERP
jgi:competence ComEA-like helix-hairpin-helix protein